jgi:SAM-dependent methyltransferase
MTVPGIDSGLAPLVDELGSALRDCQWAVALAIAARLSQHQPGRPWRQVVDNYRNTHFVAVGQILPDSPLGLAIHALVAQLRPKAIVDVGAGAGLGSTQVLRQAAADAGLACLVYALELEPETFNLLRENCRGQAQVVPLWGTFLQPDDLPEWEQVYTEIEAWGHVVRQFLPEELYLWYRHGRQLVDAFARSGSDLGQELPADGLGLVLLDGGLFFASQELDHIAAMADCIVLDDVLAYKNYATYHRLRDTLGWAIVAEDLLDRHGWAIFCRPPGAAAGPATLTPARHVFVDEQRQVHWDDAAAGLIAGRNDQRFASPAGIVRVDAARWQEAQRYETSTWLDANRDSRDDRNADHSAHFDDYRAIAGGRFAAVVEVGCGPFTNLRLLLPRLQPPERVDLLDPLIEAYLKHPHCAYAQRALAGFPVGLIARPLEEWSDPGQYDLLVCINVFEHCRDSAAAFAAICRHLKPGGVLVCADNVIRDHELAAVASHHFDAGHPLRLGESYFYAFLRRHFAPLYERRLYGLYGQSHRLDVYWIGRYNGVV